MSGAHRRAWIPADGRPTLRIRRTPRRQQHETRTRRRRGDGHGDRRGRHDAGDARVGRVADRGHRLRHQPDQPAHVRVRAELRRGAPGDRGRRALLHRLRARRSTPAPSSPRWPTSTASSSSTRRPPAAAAASTSRRPQALHPQRQQRPGRHRVDGPATSSSTTTATPNRVYVTGASSGGMMTNVLLGDYPDVFKAGAAFMGVPFGCFATTDGSCGTAPAPTATIIKTPQQWGDLVRGAFPGYTGAAAADAALARHRRHHAALPELRRRDQAVDQRPRREPDAGPHRHAAVRLDPHPLRQHRHHGAGRGDQRARASGTACR